MMSAVIAGRERIAINTGDLVIGVVDWIVDNVIDSRRLHFLARFKYLSYLCGHSPPFGGMLTVALQWRRAEGSDLTPVKELPRIRRFLAAS